MIQSIRAIAMAATSVLSLGPALAQQPQRVAADAAAAFAAPSEVSAALTESGHVDVKWKNNATMAGGCWVEFTNPGSDFVKLAAVWPETTTFRHPDVAPDSIYSYCIRPFFGGPSEAVAVTTGPAPPEGAPETAVEGPIEEPAPDSAVAPGKPLKDVATFAEAAPTSLAASLVSPTAVELRWKDQAADEDGYLVEISLHPDRDFQICALLPPGAASFRKTMLPPETKCWFRVRAFFNGEPSAIASVSTSTPASAAAKNSN
jgi:hypothetical protein